MKKTYIVLGNYRGGTSLVSGLLMLLGIYMGDIDRMDGNLEDKDFQQKSDEEIREVIKKRNNQYDIWGWKEPGLYPRIRGFFDVLRNPHFIIVFRDPVATALSRAERNYINTLESSLMTRTNSLNKSLIDFYISKEYPAICLSFERLLRKKIKDIKQLVNFLDVNLDEKTLMTILDFIRIPDGYDYNRNKDFIREIIDERGVGW